MTTTTATIKNSSIVYHGHLDLFGYDDLVLPINKPIAIRNIRICPFDPDVMNISFTPDSFLINGIRLPTAPKQDGSDNFTMTAANAFMCALWNRKEEDNNNTCRNYSDFFPVSRIDKFAIRLDAGMRSYLDTISGDNVVKPWFDRQTLRVMFDWVPDIPKTLLDAVKCDGKYLGNFEEYDQLPLRFIGPDLVEICCLVNDCLLFTGNILFQGKEDCVLQFQESNHSAACSPCPNMWIRTCKTSRLIAKLPHGTILRTEDLFHPVGMYATALIIREISE